MKYLTDWFLDNPVAANLLMVFILTAGLLSLQNLRVESFPQIPPTRLEIATLYPGGTATQVDEGITQRIEEAISGIAGINSVTSQSRKGLSSVVVKKNTGTDLDRLIEEIRNQVEGIQGFPALAERPRIYRDEYTNLAAFVLVYGGTDDDLIQQVSTRVETALKKHPDISKVTNLGKRKRQLVVEPSPEKLRLYGLNIETIAAGIEQWSHEHRSGELKSANGNIVLQGSGYADNLIKLGNIPIVHSTNASVRLGDVATIKRDFEDTDSIVRFQGKQAVALMVSTSQKDNLFHISDAIGSVLDELKPVLPNDIQLDVMADMSPYIAEQLDLLGTNAWQGFLIVLLLLGLFLEVRLAFWVAVGIPVSIAGAVGLMGLPALDYSINDITLFGFILALGILVDDAVVVGESIHKERQRIDDPKLAARHGVKSVAVATTFGVLTTVAAFSPMLWIENELAKVLAGFSAVVIFALLFSLIESKFILPGHLSYQQSVKKPNIADAWLSKLRTTCLNALECATTRLYIPLLTLGLKNKKLTLALFVSFFLFAYGALFKGHIDSVFFPEIPGRYATIKISMLQDSTLPLISRNTDQLESAIKATSEQLIKEYGLTKSPIKRYLVATESTHEIELTAELSPEALANIPNDHFLKVLKEATGNVEGSYAVNFSLADEPAGGTAIAIAAKSRETAKQVADELKQSLAALPGVKDIYDDGQGGKRQLNIRLNARGERLGLDQRQLAVLIGGAYGNMEVHRILDQGEETQVLVRFPERNKKTITQLKSTPVMLAKDSFVTLGEIADLEYTREAEVLYRRNRDQVITVYLRQIRSVSSPEETWARIQRDSLPTLSKRYPEAKLEAVGEFAEITEVQAGFKKAMLLTLLLIYVLLAVPLKSYWQPFVIMLVIPFGFAGAILGHGIMDVPVSLLSMFGMMAMTGVVINDSLVLMTAFNQLHATGMPLKSALIETGKSRLRPIFLTTVTTVCGLIPLLSESSEQAQYLKPAAISLVFGELFATPITLILIPVILGMGRYRSRAAAPHAETGKKWDAGIS